MAPLIGREVGRLQRGVHHLDVGKQLGANPMRRTDAQPHRIREAGVVHRKNRATRQIGAGLDPQHRFEVRRPLLPPQWP